MFNDAFSLTEAVLSGRKTQTRRVYKTPRNSHGGLEVENNCIITFDANGCEIVTSPKYKVGEVVAVAQNYKRVTEYLAKKSYDVAKWMDDNHITTDAAGWLNKMFVKAELMIFKIRITNVRVERLQDISDEDCIKEGIQNLPYMGTGSLKPYAFYDTSIRILEWNGWYVDYDTPPREAYAVLIDKISGKGTWQSNPYTFVYDFELLE